MEQTIIEETPELIKKSIKEFKDVLKGESDTEGDSDDVLLRFIRARKFEIDRAVILYKNYKEFVKKSGYDKITYDECYPVFLKRMMAFSSFRDKTNHPIFLMNCAKYDELMAEFEPDQIMRAFWYMLDENVWNNEDAQKIGISFLMSMKGMHMFSNIKKMMAIEEMAHTIYTKTYPLRIAGMVATDEPLLIDAIMVLARVFMSKKLISRIRFVGEDYSKIGEVIDVEHVPNWIGGPEDISDDQYFIFPDRLTGSTVSTSDGVEEKVEEEEEKVEEKDSAE